MGQTQELQGTWYVLRVISGQEERIKKALEREKQYAPWGEHLLQVFIPKEKVYQVRQGKKVLKERNIMPGYMFIEVDELTDTMKEDITRIPGVVSFLTKSKHDPHP